MKEKHNDTLSPYLTSPKRLADVIAAIQVMGVYKFYKADFASWSDRICADKTQANHWRKVFEDHPEFFRLDGAKAKASLVWRRQFPRIYHVDRGRELTSEELQQLPAQEHDTRVSRRPLAPSDVNALVTAAMDLHTRALEHQRERRWWVDVLVAVFVAVASLVGAMLGGYLSGR